MKHCAYHEICSYEDQTNELVVTGKHFSSCRALVMHADASNFYLLNMSVIYLRFTVEGELIFLCALIFVTNVKLSDR